MRLGSATSIGRTPRARGPLGGNIEGRELLTTLHGLVGGRQGLHAPQPRERSPPTIQHATSNFFESELPRLWVVRMRPWLHTPGGGDRVPESSALDILTL